jgi:hypothetical protein
MKEKSTRGGGVCGVEHAPPTLLNTSRLTTDRPLPSRKMTKFDQRKKYGKKSKLQGFYLFWVKVFYVLEKVGAATCALVTRNNLARAYQKRIISACIAFVCA